MNNYPSSKDQTAGPLPTAPADFQHQFYANHPAMLSSSHQDHHQSIPMRPTSQQPNTMPVYRSAFAPKLNYCEMVQKHKPQSNSIAGGSFLFMASGLHIAWGIWRWFIMDDWVQGTNRNLAIFILTSWYVAAIIGSIVSAIIGNIFRKKTIVFISATMQIIGSILFIVWYDHAIIILVGRMLAGMSHGIIYISTISHGAENAYNEMRGRIIAPVALLQGLSILITTLIWLLTSNELYSSPSLPDSQIVSPDLIIGAVGLVYAALAILSSLCLTYESVPWLMMHNRDQEALVNMIKLRSEAEETWSVRNDFQEMKLMVSQDQQESKNIFTDGNFRPLVLLTTTRLLSVLTSNMLLNCLMILFTQGTILFNMTYMPVLVAAVFLTGARVIGNFFTVFMGDAFGRKWFLSLSGGMSGILLLAFGILTVLLSMPFTIYMFVILILIQLFFGYGIDPMVHVITSEAFSMTKKPWSIWFITFIEYLLQIVFLVVAYSINIESLDGFLEGMFLATGCLILILTLVLHVTLPDARVMSLKQCRDEFRGDINRGVIYSRENVASSQGITYA